MPTMTFKVSQEESMRIRREARRHHAPVSAYIRARLLAPDAETPRKMLVRKHPLSGLPYDANPGAVRATEAEIAEALAVFP